MIVLEAAYEGEVSLLRDRRSGKGLRVAMAIEILNMISTHGGSYVFCLNTVAVQACAMRIFWTPSI